MKSFFKSLVVRALIWEARLVLKKKKPFIIAVTGNLGKTTTKDAIYCALKDHMLVRRSQKSMNSEFGVPLTIIGEKSGWNNPLSWIGIVYRGLFASFDDEYPTHLVLEIGADRPGDIKSITEWIKPDITVVTQFGEVPVHVEYFKDRNAVVEEKGYLVRALKETGVFIYNADDHDSCETLVGKTNARKVSIGIHKAADVTAQEVKLYGDPISGTEAYILTKEERHHLLLSRVAGKSPVYAALPALAVARELGVPMEVAVASLAHMHFPPGRMAILEGMNGSTIIDDTYNASPKATEHGLKTLQELDCKGKKIAVLGDMLELGDYTKEEHYKIGKLAGSIAHLLLTVGVRARGIAEGALDAKMKDDYILECDTSIDAGKELVTRLEPGDVVYLKGSQSMRMERAVKMILSETYDASKVLVRQDSEWLQR